LAAPARLLGMPISFQINCIRPLCAKYSCREGGGDRPIQSRR